MSSLVVASRKSDLARIQAQTVASLLKSYHPQLEITHHFRSSLGDINLKDPLWKIPEKGVFTQDFLNGLITGEFDMVVHSWKDLPVEESAETELIATLPRADARDLLLVKKQNWAQVKGSGRIRLYTSSPRRAYNLEPFLKEFLPTSIESCEFLDVRGNVPTRLQKMMDGEGDGLIVAKAAWDRMMEADPVEYGSVQEHMNSLLSQCQWMVLPLKLNPCAPAQGALAVEVKRGREDLKKLFAPIHCQSTAQAVIKERKILKSYGGGCHQKIGCVILDRPYGQVQILKGLTDQGVVLDKMTLNRDQPHEGEVGDGEAFPFTEKESFPTQLEGSQWFDREGLAVDSGTMKQTKKHHFIARALALPKDFTPIEGACLWTAGLKTWRQLARRGFWVHGSAESLGEKEGRRLHNLIPNWGWLKWTHDQGTRFDSDSPEASKICPTYKLIPKSSHPNLHGKKNFYWMSGSSFERAAEVCPEILTAQHYCGPGHTYTNIKKRLQGHSGRVTVALDYEHWCDLTWRSK